MEIGEYKQRGGIVSGKAQRFLDAAFPICPICGSVHPEWGLKYAADLADARVRFRCAHCGSILSITTADLSGFSGLAKSRNLLVWAYTWPVQAYNAVTKTLKGKKVSESYIRIEEIGNVKACKYQIGEEVPLNRIITAR